MKLEKYLNENTITYEQYCLGVDISFGTNEVSLSDIKDKAVGFVTKLFDVAKEDIKKIKEEFGLGWDEISAAFKDKDMFKFMKGVGFKLKALTKAINLLPNLLREGLLHVFKEIHETGLGRQIKNGTVKMDEVLERYPILKKVTGPVVAGLLLYIWLNMTFIGNLDYDFDFSDMASALKGKFALEDIFGGPEGLMLTTLFSTGTLISAPWLGATSHNLVLALVYTAFKRMKGGNFSAIKKMKNAIPTGVYA